MRFHNAIILALSIIVPIQSFSMERLGENEEPVLDFRNGAPTEKEATSEVQRKRASSSLGRRFGATNHLSLGLSMATNSRGDSYTIRDISCHSFSVSGRLLNYFSLSASRGSGSSLVEYPQFRRNGPLWSNEYYTFDPERDLESRSYAAGLRVDLFGMAPSSPYVAVSRFRTEQKSELTLVGKRYDYSNGELLETLTSKIDEGEVSDYMTNWSVGYEWMLSNTVSAGASFSHAFNDDRHSRSFGASINLLLSRHVGMGFGVSHNHDAENNGGGIGLSLVL